ncbi:MAG: hypothetical protein IJW78_04025 [Clostridia bacterium]|nr:hypothetical protein [Clostridia bacterium]
MSFKHIMWFISILVAVVAMAAGVAVLVNRYLIDKDNEEYEFIECDDEEEIEE